MKKNKVCKECRETIIKGVVIEYINKEDEIKEKWRKYRGDMTFNEFVFKELKL